MNEMMKKAFDEGKMKIVIDNYDRTISIEYFVGDGTDEQTVKYNIIIPNIQDTLKAIQYVIGYCTDKGKVNAYLKNIGILKGIFKFYTDMPDDMFSEDEVNTIINKCILSYDDMDLYEHDIFLRRFYDAVCEELDNIREKYIHSGGVLNFDIPDLSNISIENEELKGYLGDVWNAIFENIGNSDTTTNESISK